MTLYGPKEEELELVLAEINENQSTLEQNLRILHNWLSCQPHLPHSIDDQILRVFLRGCKHNVERTKRKIDNYYTGRTAVPELFSNRDPCSSDIKIGARILNVYPLSQLTPEGCRVTIHSFHEFDFHEFDILGIIKYLLMIADIRLMEETPISGDIFLFDLQYIMLTHYAKLTGAISLLRKTLILAQEAYPQRLKEIHIINAPPFVDWILNVFRSLMKEKMKNRTEGISVNDMKVVPFIGHEAIGMVARCPLLYRISCIISSMFTPVTRRSDITCLKIYCLLNMAEMERPFRNITDWMKKLESYQEWFKKQESVKVDEKRRIYKEVNYKTNHDLFGYEGAFRSLNID